MLVECDPSPIPAAEAAQLRSAAEVEVDGQTSESWDGVVAKFADATIYQTWAYGAVRWGARNLSHLVMRREGQVLGAAQVRITRVPFIRAGAAYVRWGPLCERTGEPFEPIVVSEMIAQLRQEYVRRRGLALQIVPNAPATGDRAAAFGSAFRDSALLPEASLGSYRTVIVDLRPNLEGLRKQLDQKWRNQLNRSENNGLVVEVSGAPEAYREFVQLYEVMRKRKQFDTSVDVMEFDRIRALLSGPAKLQTFLARKDGIAIGALVCSRMGDSAIYLFGATNEQARDLKASYFLHWQAMTWLKDRGGHSYDLGGIDPEANPGGYHFKRGFGGKEVTHLSTHAAPGGLCGWAILRGMIWLARRRSPRQAKASAAR